MLVPGQPAKKLAKNQPAARIPSVLQVASEISGSLAERSHDLFPGIARTAPTTTRPRMACVYVAPTWALLLLYMSMRNVMAVPSPPQFKRLIRRGRAAAGART